MFAKSCWQINGALHDGVLMIASAIWLAPRMDQPVYALAVGVLAGGALSIISSGVTHTGHPGPWVGAGG